MGRKIADVIGFERKARGRRHRGTTRVARRCGWIWALAGVAWIASCGGPAGPTPVETLAQYLDASNRHDIEALRDMIAEDAEWVLPPDTLRGRDAMTRPIVFDKGANAKRDFGEVTSVRGDTIEFTVTEKSDVLASLGVAEMHHALRMVTRGGMIHLIAPLRPPPEQQMYADSLGALVRWLRRHRPGDYGKLWRDGRLNYTLETGEELPNMIRAWRRRR